MRSVIGVNSVKATLEKSLLRAQKRFNLSNPPSVAKNKRSLKKIEDRKVTKKLLHIARQNRLRFGSQLPDEQVAADWRDLCVNPLHLEFTPSVDKYSDFINKFKSQTTIFDRSDLILKNKEATEDNELLESPRFPTKKKKKGETKRLRKLRKLYRKTQEKLKSIEPPPPEDEEPLIPKPVCTSKLELIREERKKVRTLEKAIKKEAQRIRLEQQEAAAGKRQKQKLKGKTMKETMTISSIEDTSSSSQTSNGGGGGETQVVDSCPSPSVAAKATTNVTAKLTLITNGSNGVIKKPLEPQLPKPKHTIFPRERVQLGWIQKHPTGCGFSNLGNSCFMNSTLQAVFHIPSFVNWLLNDEVHVRQCQSSQRYQQCMVCAMRNTLEESMKQSDGFYGIRPHQIHNKLRMISKNFVPGRQEDAHEFLRHLLESMDTCYLRAYGAPNLDTRSKETTPLGQIFGGYLRTEVTCLKCHHVSTTFQPLAELQLDIRHATTVEDAISHHFRKEKVDNNDYKCEGCRSIAPVMKQFSLELAPVVLCLQLKRFTLFGGKLSKPVHCNRYLDLTKYLHKSLLIQNHRELKYHMVALITHIGSSPNGGHYTAIAQTSSGTMYQFDDSYVRSVSPTMAQNTDAYVIIYEMVRGQETKPGSPEPLKPAHSISIAAQIRNSPITINGLTSRIPKPSTITSATARSVTYPAVKSSKLVSSPSGKFKNPFADKYNPDRKPTVAAVTPFGRALLNGSSSVSTQATNGNGQFVSPDVKPRTERQPISFSLKNTVGDLGGSKIPIARPCLTTLRPPLAPQPQQQQRQKTLPQLNGPSSSLSQSPKKPHSLVPYDNEDDSEEGTPKRNSRERSVTPSKSNGDTIKKKFDGNLITAPIKSWNENGGSSILAKATELSRKRELTKSETDVYNEELDAGRVKKRKLDASRSPSRDNSNSGLNKFQKPSKSLSNLGRSPPSTPLSNGFSSSKEVNISYRSHHQSSGISNGGDSRSTPSHNSHHSSGNYHQSNENPSYNNNHNNNDRPNTSSFRNNGYGNDNNQGGGFRRYNSAPHNRHFNNGHGGSGGRSHHGGGGGRGRGTWRGGGGNSNYYKGSRNYTNYHR